MILSWTLVILARQNCYSLYERLFVLIKMITGTPTLLLYHVCCLASGLFLLASCTVAVQQQPTAETASSPASTIERTTTDQNSVAEPTLTDGQIETAEIEYGNFSEDILTRTIMAELAGQRGQDGQALTDYATLARETGNLSIIARATRIATFMSNIPLAMEMGKLWLEKDPDSAEARRFFVQHLLETGRYREALVQLLNLLEQGSNVEFGVLAQRLANDPNAGVLLDALLVDLDTLLVRYPDNTSLRLTLVQLYQQNKQYQEAYEIARQLAIDLNDNAEVVIQEVRLLELMGELERAQSRLVQSLNNNPDNKQLRFMYGNRLLNQQKFLAAKEQFALIIEQDPDDFDMVYSLALLSLQMNMFDDAKMYLQRLVVNNQHLDDAHFYLGNINVQQSNVDAAIDEYLLVKAGNNFLQAQRSYTELMLRADRYQEVKTHLQNIRFRNPDYNIPLLSIEASVLMEEGRPEQAALVLNNAVGAFPNNVQLLFLRSLLSQDQNDLPLMEQDLRKIILLSPTDATAYNSLGYTLADRTDRYQEAYTLIQRAIELSPDEPSIIDSLGWVQYRLGLYDDARKNLDRAYSLFPDAEVAAHLGEVLWVMGERAAANRVWRGALEKQPDSKHVLNAMERLNPGAAI